MKRLNLFIALFFGATYLSAQTVTSFAEGMNTLVGITINAQNEVLAIEHDSGKIMKINAAGNPTEFATTGGYGGAITIDSWDSIFVIEPFLSKFIKMGPDAGSQELGTFSSAQSLFAKDTTLYYTTQTSVFKLDKKNMSVIAEYTGFLFAEDIAIDASNNIYVADRNDRKLYKVEHDSSLTVLASNIENITGVAYANDVLYFTNYKSYPITNKIMKYDLLTNTVSDYITEGLNQPKHIAIDRLGHMYVTNGDGSIVKISDDALLPTTVFFRDPYFKKILIQGQGNTNQDKEIQLSEAYSYTGKINLSFGNAPVVRDLLGLEQFKNITKFHFWGKAYWGHGISRIDLSANTKLEEIWCSYNNIDELILPSTPTLTLLKCSMNNISVLDISGVPNLVKFAYKQNNLPNIDLSALSNLEFLYCNDNNIQELDVTTNTKLKELAFSDNNISSIDLSNNTELTKLIGEKNNLPSIDLSSLTKLEECFLSENQLTELELATNLDLKYLDFSKNLLNNIDLTSLTKLVYIEASKTDILAIDLTKNTELTYFNAAFNDLSTIDLSKNLKLKSINLGFSNISTLDLSHNDSLKWVVCSSLSNLETIDLRNNHNSKIIAFSVNYDFKLSCIYVDDATFCDTTWNNNNYGTFVENETQCNQVVSIPEQEILDLLAYPVPTNDVLHFESAIRLQKIEVFNRLGQLVALNNNKLSIDLSALPPGFYFAKATNVEGAIGLVKIIRAE